MGYFRMQFFVMILKSLAYNDGIQYGSHNALGLLHLAQPFCVTLHGRCSLPQILPGNFKVMEHIASRMCVRAMMRDSYICGECCWKERTFLGCA